MITFLDDQLSANFFRSEFRCKCSQNNNYCGGSAPVSPYLIEVLQLSRDRLGVPIYCVRKGEDGKYLSAGSGFRCLKHNRDVGSGITSYHPKGMAADIWTDYDLVPYDDFLRIIKETIERYRAIHKKGYILPYNKARFIHVDTRLV